MRAAILILKLLYSYFAHFTNFIKSSEEPEVSVILHTKAFDESDRIAITIRSITYKSFPITKIII